MLRHRVIVPPPAPASLRDRLLEAEQLRTSIDVCPSGSEPVRGRVRDVGLDHVTVETADGIVDVALFHIVSIRW